MAYAETFVFNDMSGDEWYANSVSRLFDKGVVEGYENGTYSASNSINRAEMATMLDRSMNYIMAYDLAHSMILWSFDQSTWQEIYIDGTVIVESSPNAGGDSPPVLNYEGIDFLTSRVSDVSPEDLSFCKEAFSTGMWDIENACEEIGTITTNDVEFGVE